MENNDPNVNKDLNDEAVFKTISCSCRMIKNGLSTRAGKIGGNGLRIIVDALLYQPQSAGIGRYIGSLLAAYVSQYNAIDHLDVLALPGQEIPGVDIIYPPDSLDSSRQRIWYEQWRLPLWLSTRSYDVVHFPDYQLPVLRPVKHTIITVHDLVAFKYPQMFPWAQSVVKRELMKQSVKVADHIIVPSEATAGDLQEILHVSREKISVIAHGVPFQTRKTLVNVRDRPYFLAVGTIEPRKNFEGVIHAFAEFVHANHLEGQVDLVIAGKKGWLYTPVLEAPKKWNIEESISLLEYVPDETLQALYQHSIALVYPSFYEGFGLPILEAMAQGTPVIASNQGALAEVCGDAALIVDPKNIDQLAQYMLDLWEKPTLREALRQKGLKRAKSYTWDQVAEKTREVYQQVAQL